MELTNYRHVFFDTNVLIYALEGHDGFQAAAEVFRLGAGHTLHTSALTLMEYAVPAYASNRSDLIDRTAAFLRTAHVRIHPIDERIALRAAELRSETKLKPVDALQLAAALSYGSEVFVTADRDFPPRSDIVMCRIIEGRFLDSRL